MATRVKLDPLVQRELQVPRAPMARTEKTEPRVPRVLLVHKDRPVLQVLRVLMDPAVLRVLTERTAHQEMQERRAQLVQRAPVELREIPVPRVIKAP